MLSRYVVSQVKHNSYFLVGLGIGLWLALATVPLEEEVVSCDVVVTSPVADEFEPHREERPLGPAGQAGRSVQRPRYYSTELGMRGGLLSGVLSSEDALRSRAAALNHTAARLQPALRFFITASALRANPGRANVVGFTDTREMLKPFHALKYLADNYLEEYDFFFLVSDTSFVNARRLTELVSKLSVSQDIYMGAVADDDTHYCTLEGGIVLSNSVLRAVHGELDWCVRNSYSPHHHENLGRCVLHAAGVPCADFAQGERYLAARAPAGGGGPLHPELADAVTVHPALQSEHFYQLHAYVSRVYLERAQAQIANARADAAVSARRHPHGYRNASWPPALRADAGLATPTPPTRFDHLRWTRFNLTHALQPDDQHAVTKLSSAYKQAVDLIVEEASAWVSQRWGTVGNVSLEEGAWCWEPPRALRYRLLLRLHTGQGAALLQLEAARALGAARLAPARYVTESARVHLVLPVFSSLLAPATAFLTRYESVCLQKDANTALYIVAIPSSVKGELNPEETTVVAKLKDSVHKLAEKHRASAHMDVIVAAEGLGAGEGEGYVWGAGETARLASRLALKAALPSAGRDSLLLLAVDEMEFTEDFLNRVRMNTILGSQWFSPLSFSRFSQYSHPLFVDADGSRPSVHTGRFAHTEVLSVYKQDYVEALDAWKAGGGDETASASRVLSAAALRVVRAPEPALLLPPQPPPCELNAPPPDSSPETAAGRRECLRRERDRGFLDLHLGAKQSLAKLLLQTQAELAR